MRGTTAVLVVMLFAAAQAFSPWTFDESISKKCQRRLRNRGTGPDLEGQGVFVLEFEEQRLGQPDFEVNTLFAGAKALTFNTDGSDGALTFTSSIARDGSEFNINAICAYNFDMFPKVLRAQCSSAANPPTFTTEFTFGNFDRHCNPTAVFGNSVDVANKAFVDSFVYSTGSIFPTTRSDETSQSRQSQSRAAVDLGPVDAP